MTQTQTPTVDPQVLARIETVAYHRNGVGGDAFLVAIINDPEHGRVLYTDFAPMDEESDPDGTLNMAVAVVPLDNIARGALTMADGATLRGDRFADTYRQAVYQAMSNVWDERDRAAGLTV